MQSLIQLSNRDVYHIRSKLLDDFPIMKSKGIKEWEIGNVRLDIGDTTGDGDKEW